MEHSTKRQKIFPRNPQQKIPTSRLSYREAHLNPIQAIYLWDCRQLHRSISLGVCITWIDLSFDRESLYLNQAIQLVLILQHKDCVIRNKNRIPCIDVRRYNILFINRAIFWVFHKRNLHHSSEIHAGF